MIRKHKRGHLATEAFLGFGDPALTDQEKPLGKKSQQSDFMLLDFLNRGSSTLSIAGTKTLRSLESLPTANKELTTLASLFKVNKKTRLFLRDQATETQLKVLSEQGILKKQRIIAFATHALLANASTDYKDLKLDTPESGLVFTPPKHPSEKDDGYLSAVEASRLNLNADWVILSACETGVVINKAYAYKVLKNNNKQAQIAASTSFDTSGLSALAKSFFYAGSRNLLVSQWSVIDSAGSQIVTDLFTKTNGSKSERLQQAMQTMIKHGLQTKKKGKTNKWAHPIYWAPYLVLGDGA
jgi:CHAT domain-containing protein